MKQTLRRLLAALAALLLLVGTAGCGEKTEQGGTPGGDEFGIDFSVAGNEAQLSAYETENPVVAMQIEGYGAVVFELYPDLAPESVNNFLSLVRDGFYDGNSFHRLVPGFVLQGGDPQGIGIGGPGYSIKGEFALNGVENGLKHTLGVLSMARSQKYDSAGSQFFIMLGTAASLDGGYAAFGRVIAGMENIEKIAATEKVANSQSGKLSENVTIKKALADTKGVEYPEPTKLAE